jgi:hypothetical protein
MYIGELMNITDEHKKIYFLPILSASPTGESPKYGI